jgi:hypothetical protein
MNGEPVRKKYDTPHYNYFYGAIRYQTLKLQHPEAKGSRKLKVPPRIVFSSQTLGEGAVSSLLSLRNESEDSGDSSDGVLTVKYDFFLFTTISTGEKGGGGKDDVHDVKKLRARTHSQPKANQAKELSRELSDLTIGDGDSTEVRDLKAGAVSVVHGHQLRPWTATKMGPDLQKMCSEQLPPIRKTPKRILESDDESDTEPQTGIAFPQLKKKKNDCDESEENEGNDGDDGDNGRDVITGNGEVDGSGEGSDDESGDGNCKSSTEDEKSDGNGGGDGIRKSSEDDEGSAEGSVIEEDDEEDDEEKSKIGGMSTPSTKSNQSRSQSVMQLSPRLQLTEVLETHCKLLPQMIGPVEKILGDLVKKGSEVTTVQYVLDLLRALGDAYQQEEEEDKEVSEENEDEEDEEEEGEEADKGTIPVLEAHSFEVPPDRKTRFDVDLTGDNDDEMEVDGARSLRQNDGASSLGQRANVLFDAFNNLQLRTQLMEINFPMGPVDSMGTEEVLCIVPLTGVWVHQDKGMQESILAKREGWDVQHRPKDCPIHPLHFPFRFMSDEVAYLSPALFANGLGKEGCSSKLHGSQVEFFDSGCYTLYNGPGDALKMTRETSKEGFERLVKKSPRKYARLLDAKQVHCFIHGNSHWSLLVLINSEDPLVPSCFLGVDHFKHHEHVIHAHNLNWYYILPFLDVILLILVLLKFFLSFEASNQAIPFPGFRKIQGQVLPADWQR